jgi:hypothetical protein
MGYELDERGKGNAMPFQARTGPEGSRILRLPEFKTVAHEAAALRTGRLYAPGNIPGIHFR